MSASQATVLHVDLDAFFVSMELLRRPELRGLPVVVAGALGARGVVSTCSYEARRFGVRSAMPVSQARRLCPQAVYLPTDFPYYSAASATFHAILRDFTPTVEPGGLDEAYLDVRGCEPLFGSPAEIAQAIRGRIRGEIGITASVGVSANKLVSKVASDAGKPDGLVVVPVGEEAAFLAGRPVRDLPMAGPRVCARLESLGVRTIGEVAALPATVLEAQFGRFGRELRARAQGLYEAPVSAGRGPARSISRETTFEHDEGSEERLLSVLRSLAERVAGDMANQSRSARTLTLKLRFPPFETLTRSHTAGLPLASASELHREASSLFLEAWSAAGRRPVRLVGVSVSNLQEPARQLALGDDPREPGLATVLAGLRDRFGDSAPRAALTLRTEHERETDLRPD